MNKSKNILVVDDNKENLFFLIELLNDEGYTPFPANSGELALASLENNTPDLILLDIRMPRMDGFEVCRRIKQNENLVEIPIIFLTAEIEISEKLEGFRIGAVDYLTKPFHAEELIARLNIHLKLYHYNQHYKKQVAAKIIENEAKHVIEKSPVIVFIWKNEENWPVEFVSKNVVNIFGYTAKEFVTGETVYGKIIHSDDLQKVTDEVTKNSTSSSQSFEHEPYRVVCKSGGIKWIRDDTFIIRNKKGEITHYEGILIDITKQIEAEQKLKKQNKELKIAKEKVEVNQAKLKQQVSLFDEVFVHSLDSIVLLDKDYNFIKVSHSYAKSCEREVSEFPGNNHFDFYPSDLKEEFDEIKQKKTIYKRNARPFVFSDHPEWGTSYWDLGLVPILDKNSEIEFFFFTLKDVTKRVEIEIKLKKQNEELLIAKENTEVSEYNLQERVKELEGIFSLGLLSEKYERLDDIFNEFVTEIVPNSMQFPEKIFVSLQVNNKEYTNLKDFSLPPNLKEISSEIKIFNKNDGKLTVAYVENLPFIKKYEQKLINAYAEKISNIIESKLTEQKILKVMIKAEDKERAKLAKELHDGLGPLLATSKLYSKALINTKSKKEINFIISKINETVEESLQCSQEISNNLSPHILHNFGLTTAIESFASKLSAIKDINFDFQSNIQIRIDENVETTLYRVTVELIHNSIKHAKAKDILIKITLADNKINYVYSDNGIGFNVNSVMKENKGMGLTNIYSRIKSLNGTINMDSEKENGLRVVIVVNLD